MYAFQPSWVACLAFCALAVAPTIAHAQTKPAQFSSATEAKFFGLSGRGTRFVFVVDRSASMDGPRLEAAKREVISALGQLKRSNQFQVIFYNEQPKSMARLAFADENGLAEGKSYVESASADGGTDHLRAMQAALRLGPDVVFFLTDAGEPGISAKDLKKIRESTVATIHVVEIADDTMDQGAESRSLKQLAEENRGEYKRVDATQFQVK